MPKKSEENVTVVEGAYVSPSLEAARAGEQVTFPMPEADQQKEQLG